MNYTSITLGELLSSENEIIKKHAVGILKALQKRPCIHKWEKRQGANFGSTWEECIFCETIRNFKEITA